MRVRVEPAEYPVVDGRGRRSMTRAYALVSEAGKPLFVGLFVSREKAEAYCKERGWSLVRKEAA